jgi:TolB protein
MRRLYLMVACVLGAAACSPLRQPLGSLAAVTTTGGAGAAGTSGAGASAGAGTLTGNQIPSLPPDWNQPSCDPTVFRCFEAPGSSPSSPASALFGGTPDPDPTSKPVIVYPLDGAMHPINSADITFQWRRAPGAAQTVFRIRLRRVNGDVFEFFVPCNPVGAMDTECAFGLPPGAWLDAATTARGETLTVDLTGVDPSHPATFSTSDPIALSFSPEDVRGGLYYWSSAVTGTQRLLFGARASESYIVHNAKTTVSCGGCHAVSRDGSSIAWEQGDTGKGVLWVASTNQVDTPRFTPSTTHDCGIQALNHDGTRVLVSYSGRLILRDAKTGMTLGEVDETQLGFTMHAFHPEWSPDDQSIAVTVSANGDSDWAVRTGAIGVLPYNNGQFGKVEIIVPTGTAPGSDFNFYPTWSPDGHLIAFATGKVGMPMQTPPETSYVQSTARLRLVNVDTKVVVELTAATGTPGRTSTWPKFAPFSQAGGVMFLTFNTKLDYGFLLPNSATGQPQLWIAAIDGSKPLQAGVDPSRPPVWLAFQDVTQRNYATAWAQTVGCSASGGKDVGCGAGEICNAGVCAMVAR